MTLLKVTALILALALGAAWYLDNKWTQPVPVLPDTWWRPGNEKSVNTAIRPFSVSISDTAVDDLKYRLKNTRFGADPLIGTGWTYGMSSKSLSKVVDYWIHNYPFKKREAVLNQYPQFLTNIQGLDIHFLHVKPTNSGGKRVLPLLLQHGWPGSVVEFYKIIPLLTTPRPEYDFVFEVVVPSLPGYGFSDAPMLPGCGPTQIAVILKNLMLRLGFNEFYTQGGDWGAIVTSKMAVMFPRHVLGSHQNMCNSRNFISMLKTVFYSVAPTFFMDAEDAARMYPISKFWSFMFQESGYFHIQATKPDTVSAGLSDSPAGLAAYILEKFSTGTDPNYRNLDDGGLLKKFTMDELLDNLMLYWLPNKISSAVRIYAEAFSKDNEGLGMPNIQINVPTACAQFPHEFAHQTPSILRDRYKTLIRVTRMKTGGHFAAMEEPKLLADDVWISISEMEDLRRNPSQKK